MTDKLRIEEIDNITIATFIEESLDKADRIKLLEDEFAALAKDKENVRLILDFSNVWYISSAVLGKLVMLRNWIIVGNGKLKLSSLRRDILDIFKITRLDRFFQIYPDRRSALDVMETDIIITD
ncbi:MAG: STAS domain-containing protein [Planctomycetes bacterium]|nr:STAS domain-containing protein [Planctomycetota bacterium]